MFQSQADPIEYLAWMNGLTAKIIGGLFQSQADPIEYLAQRLQSQPRLAIRVSIPS